MSDKIPSTFFYLSCFHPEGHVHLASWKKESIPRIEPESYRISPRLATIWRMMLDPARDQRSCNPSSGDRTSQFSLLWAERPVLVLRRRNFLLVRCCKQIWATTYLTSSCWHVLHWDKSSTTLNRFDRRRSFQRRREYHAAKELGESTVLTSCSLSALPRAGEGER